MKKWICAALVLSLILNLSACGLFSGRDKDTCVFYYEQVDYQYGESDAVICGEARDNTGHVTDLQYLLSLYMLGPVSTELRSPFPVGMQVLDVSVRLDLIRVTVSEELNTLTDSRRTLALACLAMTGLELSGQDSIVIVCGDDHVVLDRSMLTLYDNSAAIPTE